jgi:hypothetical protein
MQEKVEQQQRQRSPFRSMFRHMQHSIEEMERHMLDVDRAFEGFFLPALKQAQPEDHKQAEDQSADSQ